MAAPHPFSPRPRPALWLTACVAACLAALLAGRGLAAPARSQPPHRSGTAALGTGSASTPVAGLTYVALGASDAFGIGTYDANDDNWPAVLAGDLGGPVHLINLGIPGATVTEAARAELPAALDAQPNVVTVWLAVNDLADGVPLDAYARQLTDLLTQLRTRTHARVYTANLPDLTLLPYFAAQDPTALQAQIRVWNARIAAVCAATGTHLVDLDAYSAQLAQHPEYIADDGLHPSTLGAQALAQVFAQAIQQSQHTPLAPSA